MSLARLLRQQITYANMTNNRDRQGTPTLDPETTCNARVQKTNKVIVTPEKERTPIDAIIFVGPDEHIEKGAKVVYGNDNYRVVKIEDVVGRKGVTHHFELFVQMWSYAS